MKYYVRKITLSKYPKNKNDIEDISNIRADAVADVRTFNDELSIWEIDQNTPESIDRAILALVTSSNQERFDKIDVVVFSEQDLKDNDLRIEDSVGDTAVEELQDKHKNITNLTYTSILNVLKIISNITIKEGQVRRTRNQVEHIVRKNIKIINIDVFKNNSIKDAIEKLNA